MLKNSEDRALGCSVEMWPQVQVACIPVVVFFHLFCALAPCLHDWSTETGNGFGGKNL